MHELPKLPYDYNALEPYIDEATMKIHHTKHHQAYIDNLNKALEGNEPLSALPIEKLLANLNDVPEAIRTKVRNHGGGHANHSLFWTIMSPNPGMESRTPQGELKTAIEKVFGSFETFQTQFAASAMGRFGSGWAWLVLDNTTLAITDSSNQDSPIMNSQTPILGIDVWEHAYYLKYQNKRADYITAWWSVVNWQEVERRYAVALP